jgi:hypothetical protein
MQMNCAARNGLFRRGFFVVCFCALIHVCSGTQSVWVGWDFAPPEENIIEYRVLHGTQSGVYTNSEVSYIPNGAQIFGLADGSTNYFAVIAIDADGNHSPLSDEVSYVAAVPLPVVLHAGIQNDENGTPTMVISGSWAVPRNWKLEYSADLVNWNTWLTSYGTNVVAYAGLTWGDQFFFRLIDR